MKEENQDIYQAPPEERDTDPKLAPEIVPPNFKKRSRRNSVGFTVVMLTVFGLAAWFVFQLQEKEERPEVEGMSELLPPKPISENREVSPMVPLLEFDTLDYNFENDSQPTPTDLDPGAVTLAMGEIRIAHQYLKERDHDRAELHARRALERWPSMNVAQRMLGVIYTQRGQFDQAITLLESALKNDPFNPETYNNLSAAYMHMGNLQRAEELLDMCLELRPDYSYAELNLGMLYIAIAEYELAADYLERSLQKIPNNVAARNNLGVATLRLEDYEAARQHFDIVLRMWPDNPIGFFNKAITYALEGDYETAFEWIRKGSNYCSPIDFQRFMADHDFEELRKHPGFMPMVQTLYPGLPSLPGK